MNLKGIKKSTKIISYTTLVVAIIIGNLFSAIITILPANVVGFGSTKLSILGYVAHCSFAPWSTLISLTLVGLGAFLLVKLIGYLKTNNVTFLNLMKMFAVATVVIMLVITCFPFVLFLIGAYFLINLIKHLRPKFEERWITKVETKN